jgi:hypothetical protein
MHGLKKIAVVLAVTLFAAGCNGKQEQLHGKKPPAQGTTEKVHLIWKQADNKWMVKLNGGPEVNPDQAKSEIKKDKGPRAFEVDIQGPTNATFKTADGLTVWEGPVTPAGKKAPPPTSPTGFGSTQIVGPVVSADGKTLVFVDLNYGDAVTLNYALHFNQPTDPSKPKIPSVDPIIDNGGGEWS